MPTVYCEILGADTMVLVAVPSGENSCGDCVFLRAMLAQMPTNVTHTDNFFLFACCSYDECNLHAPMECLIAPFGAAFIEPHPFLPSNSGRVALEWVRLFNKFDLCTKDGNNDVQNNMDELWPHCKDSLDKCGLGGNKQLCSAMRKKGWQNVPEDSMPVVLQIHINNINENAHGIKFKAGKVQNH